MKDIYHTVNPDLAIKYGLNNAIFIEQLISISNLKPHDDTWFTLDHLEEIFPYWSRKTIRNITIDLTSKKLLLTSKQNFKPLDNTLHFSLSTSIYPINDDCILFKII